MDKRIVALMKIEEETRKLYDQLKLVSGLLESEDLAKVTPEYIKSDVEVQILVNNISILMAKCEKLALNEVF